jgi:protein TonB
VLVHALILLLIVAPTLFLSAQLARFDQTGAGGPGPAGGGGGGNSGAGYPALKFVRERLDYLQIAVPAAKKDEAKKKPEALQTAVPEAKPEPVPPQPAEKSATVSDSAAAAGATSSGTGSDGSRGNGPGSGGGVGSGVGPGRGSGNGPGTGGGDALVYPPMVIAMPILPVPVPSRVRPYRLEAQFDVDSLGNATLIGFNPSRDAGYNRRIRDMLLEIRFRPAVRTDGRPVRALAVIKAEAM